MLVSVVLPIYNVERYLKMCLDTLSGQTYPLIEVIGVDDCSTDGSVKIYEEYQTWNNNFRLIVHPKNKGLPGARNTGIIAANGDYILFVDSDDWLSVDAVEKLVSLVEFGSVDIGIGGVLKYFERDCTLRVPSNHGKCMSECRRNVSFPEHPALFYSVTSWNKLIRKDFIRNNNLYFQESPRRYEDMLTYMWYLSGARISNISDVTYFYRQRKVEEDRLSIMQELSSDTLIDKLKAFYNITKFTVDRGVFGTDLDPMNSPYAMMDLKRALKWVVPSLFELCHLYASSGEKKTLGFDFYKGCAVLRDIFNILPTDYCNSEGYMLALADAIQDEDASNLPERLRLVDFKEPLKNSPSLS